eukprot:CAMPEP_0168439304 /NCGR_PEP_ID=MMETSP0228-20121227/42398_1 /TAXON_ID=133427 /ORGANISM="Protoceratium reticulatum, Strain CCCM 535 (=CCMP 1889)" /LENGTH=527 /DNA_ID=CAMNT_0008453579 /DNA_START=30 /DNA_END=1610 /DNA_ORIENTATION=+
MGAGDAGSALDASCGDTASANLACQDGLQGLAVPLEEKVWCMKRDWTDEDFQRGAEANRTKLEQFEDELVGKLRRACMVSAGAPVEPAADLPDVLSRVLEPAALLRTDKDPNSVRAAVLRDPEVLGSALDIVGAYLKNYEVDKAAAVMETVLPFCREKGGMWLLKTLNHLATVRMKQARPSDALACLEEIESLVRPRLTREEMDEAWEFWETTYRNFGWIMSSLGRTEEAIEYIEKAIEVKERVGRSASWFDLWDLGRMKATIALKGNEPAKIEDAQGLVARGLVLHQECEPDDLVMRAKIWSNLGECSFALGHLADKAGNVGESTGADDNAPSESPEARKHYHRALTGFIESHKLFSQTEGRMNPLTGGSAEAAAWAFLKVGEDANAKPYLLNALEATSQQQNGWGDGDDSEAPALTSAFRIVEQVLEVHRRTDDRPGLAAFLAPVEEVCASAARRLGLPGSRSDAAVHERLISSSALVLVASGVHDGASRAQQLLQAHLGAAPLRTEQARLCRSMLLSLPGSGVS